MAVSFIDFRLPSYVLFIMDSNASRPLVICVLIFGLQVPFVTFLKQFCPRSQRYQGNYP